MGMDGGINISGKSVWTKTLGIKRGEYGTVGSDVIEAKRQGRYRR